MRGSVPYKTLRNCTCLFFFVLLVSAEFFSVMVMPRAFLAAAQSDDYIVVRVGGSVVKVCQLVGDFDVERNHSTIGLTYARYGVAGTDLGVSFEHGGELVFLFGDTVGRNSFPLSGKDDSFAHTSDENVAGGLNLTFYTGVPGRFLPPTVLNVSQGPFEVPMEGVDVNGKAYVYFTINYTEQRKMGGSILARLDDSSMNFTYLYTLSQDKFINVHTAKVNNSLMSGLPETSGEGLLLWGSGEYRGSDPYLAYIPLDSIENLSAMRYFAGLNQTGYPTWSLNESDVQALFHDPVIGELSVAWNPYLQRWIMLYSGVSMRSSLLPMGQLVTKGDIV